MLAAPGVQLGFGLAALLATAGAVRHDRVGPREVRAFRAVNGLPDSVYLPAWAVMQLGAFGAIRRRPRRPGWPETGSWQPAS